MGFLSKLFHADAPPPPPPSPDAEIELLFAEARQLPYEQAARKVVLYSEILGIMAASGSLANRAAVLRNRAVAYRAMKKYPEALIDLRAELALAGSQGDRLRVAQCQQLIEETEASVRRNEIAAAGGPKAGKLEQMERDKYLIFGDGADADRAFGQFFTDLTDADSDIRLEAARLLAESPKAQTRLISIVQSCRTSDPRRAALAGRVLGRCAAKGSDEMVHAEIGRMLFGLDLSFLPCPCAHCGRMNRGIPAPARAPFVPYYHQEDDRGAYSVPVLCDSCGREFFVVWDEDPRA